MGTAVPLITNALTGDRRKRTINPLVKLGPVSLRVLTIASAASLLLFYLAQTTQSATKSYEVQALGDKKQELTEEVYPLALEAQRLQSLEAIQQGLGDAAKDYEPAGQPQSIQ